MTVEASSIPRRLRLEPWGPLFMMAGIAMGSCLASAQAPRGTDNDFAFNPVEADLNGDGITDWAIMLTASNADRSVPIEAPQFRPWSLSPSSKYFENDFPSFTKILVLHCHGGEVGCALANVFVIEDVNSISLLDTPAALAIQALPRAEVPIVAGRPMRGPATGDVLVLPTEAGIDTYLYWNGSAYEYYLTDEIP